MNKFLVGNSEEFLDLLVITADSEKSAIIIYQNILEADYSFIESLHAWAINMSWSERFYFDEKSDGQKRLSQREVLRRVKTYFKEKPEYVEVYLNHWNGIVKGNEEENLMAYFPQDMIDWIWRKELKEGDWTIFKAINLDLIKEIK